MDNFTLCSEHKNYWIWNLFRQISAKWLIDEVLKLWKMGPCWLQPSDICGPCAAKVTSQQNETKRPKKFTLILKKSQKCENITNSPPPNVGFILLLFLHAYSCGEFPTAAQGCRLFRARVWAMLLCSNDWATISTSLGSWIICVPLLIGSSRKATNEAAPLMDKSKGVSSSSAASGSLSQIVRSENRKNIGLIDVLPKNLWKEINIMRAFSQAWVLDTVDVKL